MAVNFPFMRACWLEMTVGLSDANLILFLQNLEGLLQAEIANIMTLEFP